jgi:hypothetical protein
MRQEIIQSRENFIKKVGPQIEEIENKIQEITQAREEARKINKQNFINNLKFIQYN